MAMNRALFAKQLEPGLNTLFGLEHARYPEQWKEIFDVNSSSKAFEEDNLLEGFGAASVKAEGSAIAYDTAAELWTARYNHETIALAFSITEEAEEDGQYGSIGQRYVKALARSMVHTKEIKAANILNNMFDSGTGGDGSYLGVTDHPTASGTQSNILATAADLSETSLEQMLIDISNMDDDRGIPIAAMGTKLVVPTALAFVAERLTKSNLRTGTGDNDINASRSAGYLPQGYTVNNRLTDTDAFFILTDVPDGLKMFQRRALTRGMEGDFETGNIRYKTSERYSFGWTDWRGIFGTPGA
jgi:hypothetical protein|tara:strand:+ start:375 stop:1277 length:903 start_codon:yes stop_codon:yes gene_type:complete